MNKSVLILFFLLLFFTISLVSDELFPIYGVKIYEKTDSVEKLFQEWNEIGINTVFASEDFMSSPDFQKHRKKSSIQFFLISPVFYHPQHLKEHPEDYSIDQNGNKAIDDWVHFVCPSREDYLKKRCEEIQTNMKKMLPDGVSIDFIRHFVFWEMVSPEKTIDSLPNCCFCENCLLKFQEKYSISIPDSLKTTSKKSQWILKNHYQEWEKWKTELIIQAAKTVIDSVHSVNPSCFTDLHIVPWRKSDYSGGLTAIAGQDIKKLSELADFLSPMCYTHMLKRSGIWVNQLISDHDSLSKIPIIPSIQAEKSYLNENFTLEEFQSALENALIPPSQGIIIWSWPALKSNPEKYNLFKNKIQKIRNQ